MERNVLVKMQESDDLEEMTSKLNEVVAQTLDECAPIRTFKVREQHKFGLSETTKQSMKERDKLRQSGKNLTPSEKVYQCLRQWPQPQGQKPLKIK